jgi:hypothetical protein
VILSSEMAEMSWRGAKVMHPRAVELGALVRGRDPRKELLRGGPGTIITGGTVGRLETRETWPASSTTWTSLAYHPERHKTARHHEPRLRPLAEGASPWTSSSRAA